MMKDNNTEQAIHYKSSDGMMMTGMHYFAEAGRFIIEKKKAQ